MRERDEKLNSLTFITAEIVHLYKLASNRKIVLERKIMKLKPDHCRNWIY